VVGVGEAVGEDEVDEVGLRGGVADCGVDATGGQDGAED
jgi:hypothetical protein